VPNSSPHLPGEPKKSGSKHACHVAIDAGAESCPLGLHTHPWGGVRRTIDDDPARAAAVEAILKGA